MTTTYRGLYTVQLDDGAILSVQCVDAAGNGNDVPIDVYRQRGVQPLAESLPNQHQYKPALSRPDDIMNSAIEKAQAALASAEAAYLDELRRDSERSEGSGAQERRREEMQQNLQDEVDRRERALEEAQAAGPGAPSPAN